MAEKNMAIALILSIIFPGIGLVYAGDAVKGLIIFVAVIVLSFIGPATLFIGNIIALILWIYGIYATYQQVNAVNGA